MLLSALKQEGRGDPAAPSLTGIKAKPDKSCFILFLFIFYFCKPSDVAEWPGQPEFTMSSLAWDSKGICSDIVYSTKAKKKSIRAWTHFFPTVQNDEALALIVHCFPFVLLAWLWHRVMIGTELGLQYTLGSLTANNIFAL